MLKNCILNCKKISSLIEVRCCSVTGLLTLNDWLSVHQCDGLWGETDLVSGCFCSIVSTRGEKLCPGCDGSAMIFLARFLTLDMYKSWMEGRSAPVIFSAVLQIGGWSKPDHDGCADWIIAEQLLCSVSWSGFLYATFHPFDCSPFLYSRGHCNWKNPMPHPHPTITWMNRILPCNYNKMGILGKYSGLKTQQGTIVS